jgi:hypothetical protein
MDGWFYLKLFWASLTLITLILVGITLVKARGVLFWRQSLNKELDELRQRSGQSAAPTKLAIQLVENRCREVLSSFSPEIGEMINLPQFIQRIAACYHPASEHPELHVSIGALLQSVEMSLGRFDHILNRPGFRRLRRISIGNIKNAHHWYVRISSSRFFSWYFRYQKAIRRILRSRVILIPDPFMWLAYLSNRLTLLLLIKYLMIDLYLFFGKLAIEAFAQEETAHPEGLETEEDLENTLQELNSFEDITDPAMDPEIKTIRDGLIGFLSVLTTTPSLTQWKNAVSEAGRVVSRKYFPDSANPLEEAVLGPLLERSRHWIGTLGKGEEYLLARYLYRMRLDTLYRAKNLSDLVLSKPIRIFLEKAFKTYGWFKWPFKVYRWAKRRSPWGIAMEVGWLTVKKSSIVYIFGKTFDQACKELEMVYHQSRALKKD